MTRLLLFLAFLSGAGKQVAYVDLTVPPRNLPMSGRTTVGDGGIILLDRVGVTGGGLEEPGRRDPRTLPVSAKLTRLVSVVQNETTTYAVEIELTNTSEREIVLPIGDDPDLILGPYQPVVDVAPSRSRLCNRLNLQSRAR